MPGLAAAAARVSGRRLSSVNDGVKLSEVRRSGLEPGKAEVAFRVLHNINLTRIGSVRKNGHPDTSLGSAALRNGRDSSRRS